jgi:adenine-specific DNA-methyltransferase
MAKRKKTPKGIENITHEEATRKHIPTVEFETMMAKEESLEVAYERRNRDLDPQLIWRGKDMENWSDLIVPVPPLYIQEKIHPKVLVDDLRRMTEEKESEGMPQQFDMFSDFNGLPSEAAKTEFYEHDANWSNRMILGDSLQVMASLAEREGLRGKVQMIYLDPPYGIKFNSNFQWSTTSKNARDGKQEHITREPEQVKAFRDTWRDGIHSYLTYLRDRLTVARDLLTDSGSIFVQIGDENVHRMRGLLDEVFGDENFISQITFRKANISLGSTLLGSTSDFICWYAKDKNNIKYRKLFLPKTLEDGNVGNYQNYETERGQLLRIKSSDKIAKIQKKGRIFTPLDMLSSGYTPSCTFDYEHHNKIIAPKFGKSWKTTKAGFKRLEFAQRLYTTSSRVYYKLLFDDYPVTQLLSAWSDTRSVMNKIYCVQTDTSPVRRCILMSSDPGDIVIDPTCGSGTTAYVSEELGRRWITIDTSRVALALARSRIMGARYPYYLLKDSKEGQQKEAEITRTISTEEATYDNIRQGFVYERVPHVTLRSVANNAEIDVIWETFQEKLMPLREGLNTAVGKQWEEWEIPREAQDDWSTEAVAWHKKWWELRIERQKEIDASIAAKADYEYLYDKPYTDNKKVRMAGPFTVESLSPHRILGVDEDDELIDPIAEGKAGYGVGQNFAQIILENLKVAGVQQAHKEDKLNFASLTPWPGHYIGAEGRYYEGDNENGDQKRAGIFIGPEFGTVSRPDLIAAAREAAESDFDVLIACAFNYDARSTSFDSLGRVPILKARINADLHMADDLKNTGKGNLFVIFGEPDIEILPAEEGQIKVKIKGIDVFHPSTGEVRSDGAEGIALWFVDTDYNEESFFVRQAYFLGADDPYKSLKTTLKAEINRDAWDTLYSDISRPFDKPASGRIAVKAINHLGDEVMKVFRVK